MYPVSKEYLRAIRQLDRTWALDLHMYLRSGVELTLTETDIVQGSFVFKEGSTCGDSIQTGSTYANGIDFTLVNDRAQFSDYDFSDAKVTARVGLQVTQNPIYAIKPAFAVGCSIPEALISGEMLEIHFPEISYPIPKNQCIFVTESFELWAYAANRQLVFIEPSTTEHSVSLPESVVGVKILCQGTHVTVQDYSTFENLLTFELETPLAGSLQMYAADTTIKDFGISYLKIGSSAEYFGVPLGSMTYDAVEAAMNGFWNSVSGEYWYPNPDMLADLIIDASIDFEYVPLGIFNVVTSGKKLSTIPFSCLDDMYKANKSLSLLHMTYPISLQAMFDLLCILCGISSTASLRNELAELNILVNSFEEKDYSVRDILGFMGVLLAKNLRINRQGLLESFWYENTGQTTDPDIRVGNSSYEDSLVTVTGVSITDSASNTYMVGEDTYVIEFELNPLIQNEDIAQNAANLNLQRFIQIPYHPCNVPFIGDPSWQAGDIVEHIREGFSNITVPVMLHSYKFRGTGTLETKGTTTEQSTQLSATAKKLLKVQTQAKKDLNAGLTNMQQNILNQTELITSALGFYPRIDYNADGSIKAYYLMSTPEDTEETTVWAFTSAGIGVSHTGIAGPYTSSWTANDTIVAQVITADMIQTGVLAALDNLLTIDLRNGQFKAITEKGATTIEGNEATFQYWNSNVSTKPPVAYIRIDADESDLSDYTAALRIVFASNDGSTYAYIGQNITHTANGDVPTVVGPLTISHSLPIRIENSLEVVDSLVYDDMRIQRKNDEEGNTGVDFVFV